MDFYEILDEILFLVKQNAVLLGAALFLILMVVWGYQRGMMTKLLSLCSVVVTLFVEMKIYPIVMNLIRENELLHEKFTSIGRALIENSMENVLNNAMNGAGSGAGSATAAAAAGEEAVRFSFADSPLYHMLGLDVLAENAAIRIGNIAAGILCFVVIFILIRLLVKVLMLVVRGLRKIHPIAWIDSLFGALFGFAEGLIYLWIFMLVISGFPNVPFFSYCLGQIAEDPILTVLYQQNLILQFIVEILK